MPDDAILFFRLGDFYEMFFDDAKTAAPILDIALTRRNKVPMCGVPFHAVDGYLARLIRAGKKVAICEQVEDAAASRGIVRREVVRVVTPGTVTEDGILDAGRNNFLAGIRIEGDGAGLALLDLSTGLFRVVELSRAEDLRDNLRRFAPSECVAAEGQVSHPILDAILSDPVLGMPITECDDWTFEYDAAHDTLVRHFKVHSLEGYGCEGRRAAVCAAGGVLHYVREELRHTVAHVRSLQLRQIDDFLVLDDTTCRNLDLLPARGPGKGPALLNVLDVTGTAMGGRLLRDWLLHPLARPKAVIERLDAVQALLGNRGLLQDMRRSLANVRDLERLIARIGSSSGNARDVLAIRQSLEAVPETLSVAQRLADSRLGSVAADLDPLPGLCDLVARAVVEEPPLTVKDGGVIRSGYNAELDKLRNAAVEGRQWLAEYQAGERKRTGIRNLKVRHNKVFGYYIEVSRGQIDLVPEDYVRKQTLVNGERFVTPQLKEYENRIFGAQEKSVALEYELFAEVRAAVARETEKIQRTAAALAELDVLAALADRALHSGYVRPEITTDGVIRIRAGRHPVVEAMPDAEQFVPNDTLLDSDANQLLVITGPNMAGKSTYIRQVALIVVMAQMGSYVPADAARISLVDRVFTRVGASDDLARGRSTFLVEMEETANILNNATGRSLIVLDEIGRGTSTFDGISIAWAVAEHLHNNDRIRAKTLFATHYHELTDLALTMRGVKNYNVLVREQNDRIVFLRKIVPGGSDKSYGIQVARLAGMPPEVIARAREILANLEEGELGDAGQPKIARRRSYRGAGDDSQMELFGRSQ